MLVIKREVLERLIVRFGKAKGFKIKELRRK